MCISSPKVDKLELKHRLLGTAFSDVNSQVLPGLTAEDQWTPSPWGSPLSEKSRSRLLGVCTKIAMGIWWIMHIVGQMTEPSDMSIYKGHPRQRTFVSK